MKRLFPLFLIGFATPALSEDSRHMDAHEHGVGALNIAFDGGSVSMEFHAPGADIVGFEHPAHDAEDRAAIDAAVAMLARPMELFQFPDAAECTVTQASAALESAHQEHHEDHEADHEAHDEHAHEEHAEADHDDHTDDEGHTEFHAEYALTCGEPSALTGMTFAYFDVFENARELDVQLVSPAGAQAFGVERAEPRLDLRGLF